jgi:hypothetical protein
MRTNQEQESAIPSEIENHAISIAAKSCNPAGCFECDKVITVRRFSSRNVIPGCALLGADPESGRFALLWFSGFRHHLTALCADSMATPRNDGVLSEVFKSRPC